MGFLGTFGDYTKKACLLRKVVVQWERRGEMLPFFLTHKRLCL